MVSSSIIILKCENRIMQPNYSPHILADLLIRPIRTKDRKEQDLLFYGNQDLLELRKIDTGLKGLEFSRLTFSIQDELDRPKVIKQNIQTVFEILTEDHDRIESQLASGQSPLDEQIIISDELAVIKDKMKCLLEKLDASISPINVAKDRGFIPIFLLTYEQYEKYITTSEDSLFFTNGEYTKSLLFEPEYDHYELLFSSAKSPQQLLELSLQFINNPVEINKFVLCSHEPAVDGFNLYFNKNNEIAISVLKSLAKVYPEQVQYFSEYNHWIIKENLETDVLNQLFKLFDIWFDYSQLGIYSKNDFDLEFDLKTKPITTYNMDYIFGILFDYMNTPSKIEGSVLYEELVLECKKPITNSILFFNGNDFIKTNHDTVWTYAEMILIKYKCELEPEIEFLAIYSAKESKFIFIIEFMGYISDNCLLLFKNTISLLNINAFEQVNPEIILANS